MTVETVPRMKLRPARRRDLPLLFAWRQNAEVVRYLPSFKPVSWEQHVAWWRTRRHATDYMVLLCWPPGEWRAVGTVHTRHLDTPLPEVGILLGDTSTWGKGVATSAIAQLLARPELRRHHVLKAVIHADNIASQRVFEKNGFRKVSEDGRNGQWVYHWRRYGWIHVQQEAPSLAPQGAT